MQSLTLVTPCVTLPKRTRVNVLQSKNGCLTCRARKVKCDETRPTCLRCNRSSKKCEGYSERATAQHCNHGAPPDSPPRDLPDRPIHSRFRISSISHALSTSPHISSHDAIYSRLGLEILLQQCHEKTQWHHQPLWIHLLAQLLPANDAVSAAIISLGAVYEACYLNTSHAQPYHVLTRNQKALAALQKEIASLPQGLVPVFLASIVLAASEVLQRHLVNGLMHLRGAFQVLTYKTPDSLDPTPSKKAIYPKGLQHEIGSLYSLAQSLDLQTAWYFLSEPPRLAPSFDPLDNMLLTDGLAQENASMVSILHSCYHYTSRAAKFKYCLRIHTPSSLVLEQSRYIAALTEWLVSSSQSTSRSKGSRGRQSLVLRAQALSTLIYVSTILCPYEAAYDFYSAHFQQIVEIAEEVAALSGNTSPTSSLARFQFQPGIFQAIFLTAMKCRDPGLRRRALSLFSSVDREGPWDARVMTRVAQRAIEVEEMYQPSLDLKHYQKLPIPETQRLHGCGVDSSAPAESTFPVRVQAHFSLCKNVGRMLQSSNYQDSEHWILWTEDLEDGQYSSIGHVEKVSRSSMGS